MIRLLFAAIMLSPMRQSVVQAFTRNFKLRILSPPILKSQQDSSIWSSTRKSNLLFGVSHFKSERRGESTFFGSIRMFSTIDDSNSVGFDSETTGNEEWYEAGDDDDDELDDNESQNQDTDEESAEEIDEVANLYERMRSSLEKSFQAQQRKRDALQKELDKAKSLEDTMKRANLIVSNLYQLPSGTKSAVVQDWDLDGQDVELVVNDKYSSAQEESDALFAAARKIKRGSAVVVELISTTDDALVILQDMVLDLDYAGEESGGLNEGRLNLLLDRLERTSKQTGFVMKEAKSEQRPRPKSKVNKGKQTSKKQENTYRKFLSPGGCIILVGKNKRDNEAICFKEAKGDDIWMHSRGTPGAHVLLKVRGGSPKPTEACMQFAANLASFYSDARTERKAKVTTASPKHIQKPRGAPLGAVKLRAELNTLTGYPADVEDELKLAREESGVIWDESGSRSLGGKAKNKKKTTENTNQQVAKKRAEKQAKNKRIHKSGDDSADFW